ncbi:MAG: choice-of-anchor tandem repeat GloVer-containing protein [Candidatus Cybelea sp.]
MKRWNLSRGALNVCIAATLLAACGGSYPPFGGAPGAVPHASAIAVASLAHRAVGSYKVLHRFAGQSAGDGDYPVALLTDVNGTLFGTTYAGGSGSECDVGCGTVFSIGASGSEKVLYSFTGGSDGSHPRSGLIDVNGTLYGTTYNGGGGACGGCGTVFSISTTGSEKAIYSFNGGSGGGYPTSGLIDVKGKLYGTTLFGGDLNCNGTQPGCGTVYSITTTGSEHVLHKFAGGSDGELPFAGLTDVKGTLYGTTAFGGSGGCSEPCGTVYRITTAGAEKVLYSFGAAGGGSFPHAGLLDVNGVLYGTTPYGGGVSGCGGGSGYAEGCGVVYSVSTAGKLTALHRFAGKPDGAGPNILVLATDGSLYGTTFGGGTGHGSGTIYNITASGDEEVAHTFARPAGGKHPLGLIAINNTLYGTTAGGNVYRCGSDRTGCGTVFAFTLHR